MATTAQLAAVLLALALPSALSAQAAGFEGRITAEMTAQPNQAPTDVVILTKAGKSRMDMTAGGMQMYMIMDPSTETMLSVVPSQQMYMRMDLKQAAEGMGGVTPDRGATPSEPPKITRTGRHETIAARDCEHVLIESPRGGQLDICAAKGMGFFMGPGAAAGGMGRGRGNSGMPGGYDHLVKEFKDGFFPLKIEMVEGPKRTQVLLVKKVEPQKLDAALFQPPAGFQEMTMPAMPGMGRP